MPRADWPTLQDYQKANTPKTADPKSANWWGNRPKYMVSLLKGWMGEAATSDNGFGYGWLPKAEPGVDYSSLFLVDRMYKGQIKGGFVFGHNPAQSMPHSNKVRKGLDNLEWLVVGEIHHTETSDFWRRPGVDPKKIETEVFLLPSCQRGEKDGTISNSGRWHMWHYKGIEPMGREQINGLDDRGDLQSCAGPLRKGKWGLARPHLEDGVAGNLRSRCDGEEDQRLVHP